MCEYCNYEYETERESTTFRNIGSTKKGFFAMNLTLYRSADKRGCKNELIMDLDICRNGELDCEALMEKKVKISYCPFCGEKL